MNSDDVFDETWPSPFDPGPPHAGEPAEPRAATVVTMSGVSPVELAWLWPDRIPRGMLTLVDGDPGLGKSTLVLDIAARVTTGARMPLCASPPGTAADVILMDAENHLGSVVRPRLVAAGADLARVHAITAMPVPADPDAPATLDPADVARLELVIRERSAALVVVDPLAAFLPSSVDMHRDQDVRRVLRPLAAVAERTGAAVVVVRHLRKGSGSALYRGGGSIGIAGAARSVLLVAADPDDPSSRVIASIKSNVGTLAPPLRWRLADAGGVACIEWLEVAAGVTADQLAAVDVASDANEIDRAITALRSLLADGPMPAKQAGRCVRAEVGCSDATLRRARDRAGIVSAKARSSGGKIEGWTWALPDAQRSPGAQEHEREHLVEARRGIESDRPQLHVSYQALKADERLAPGERPEHLDGDADPRGSR